MGVKEDLLQVENWEQGEFFVGATIRHKILNFRWDTLGAHHDLSLNFLQELRIRCRGATLPVVIGGTSI